MRDYSIDNLRGITIISVVFIHTVFWSGMSYVPDYIRSLALFLDVPIFFMLTGMSYSLLGKINPIKQIFKLILGFTVLLLIYQCIFFEFNFNDIVDSLSLKSANLYKFVVVNGSYWFVPVYCVSLILAYGIIENFNRYSYLFVIICFLYYIFKYFMGFGLSQDIFGVSWDSLIFYTSCIICGYCFYQYKGNYWFLIYALLFLVFFLILLKFGNASFDLQKYKFPVGLPYVLASTMSVCLSVCLLACLNRQFFLLTFIGRNSLYFYMSQGFSSSLIYYLVDYIYLDGWIYKLMFIFFVNLILFVMIGYFFILVVILFKSFLDIKVSYE